MVADGDRYGFGILDEKQCLSHQDDKLEEKMLKKKWI